MKNILTKTNKWVAFFFLIVSNLFAQNEITISPNNFEEVNLEVDISENWKTFSMTSQMENNTTGMINFNWKLSKTVDTCPEELYLFVSDKFIDYENGITENMVNVFLDSMESEVIYTLHVMPRMTPGCCEMQVVFSDADDTSIIYDTVNYSIVINDASCGVVDNVDLITSSKLIEVFPNPSQDFFAIKTEMKYDAIYLYDSLGKLVMENEKELDRVEVDNLKKGIYYLTLFNQGKKIGIKKIGIL